VEKQKIEKILESARYIASARNIQGQSYIVIQNEMERFRALLYSVANRRQSGGMKDMPSNESLKMLEEQIKKIPAKDESLTYQAPVAIAILKDSYTNIRGIEDYVTATGFEVGLASANMELISNSMGLGVCYVGIAQMVADRSNVVREFLGIREDQKLVMLLVLGYPSEQLKYLRTAPRLKMSTLWK
jgi:nitroreductase